MKKPKSNSGITLIALIITIIVLLILAGVSISLVAGQNGVLNKAQDSVLKHKTAERKEREEMDSLIDNWDDILSGTISGTSISEIKSQIAENEENPMKVLINNKAVIIPPKFKIADDSGEKVEDGIVVVDCQGNEWVWVPCYVEGGVGEEISNNIKFDRYAFNGPNTSSSAFQNLLSDKDADGSYKIMIVEPYYFHEAMPENQYESIKKYGGFYIGRYEAGTDETGKIVVQKEKTPCINITNSECITNSEELTSIDGSNPEKLDGTKVFSKLCNSYVWDTTLKFIEKEHPTFTVDSTNNEGAIAGNYGDEIMNTGNTLAVCNIYDMGGNVWEYNTETYTRSWKITFRGSAVAHDRLAKGPGNRTANTGVAASDVGFRPCLFIK